MQTDEHFSIYGSDGYHQARQRGLREFHDWASWRPVVQMWCVAILALTLGAGLVQVAGKAEAGAKFVQRHLH